MGAEQGVRLIRSGRVRRNLPCSAVRSTAQTKPNLDSWSSGTNGRQGEGQLAQEAFLVHLIMWMEESINPAKAIIGELRPQIILLRKEAPDLAAEAPAFFRSLLPYQGVKQHAQIIDPSFFGNMTLLLTPRLWPENPHRESHTIRRHPSNENLLRQTDRAQFLSLPVPTICSLP